MEVAIVDETFAILVARVDETLATTVLIEVIASKLVLVKTETAPITVLLLPILVAKAAEVVANAVFVLPILVASAEETVASSALVA
jgi:uncharacterized membrane protein